MCLLRLQLEKSHPSTLPTPTAVGPCTWVPPPVLAPSFPLPPHACWLDSVRPTLPSAPQCPGTGSCDPALPLPAQCQVTGLYPSCSVPFPTPSDWALGAPLLLDHTELRLRSSTRFPFWSRTPPSLPIAAAPSPLPFIVHSASSTAAGPQLGEGLYAHLCPSHLHQHPPLAHSAPECVSSLPIYTYTGLYIVYLAP